MEETIDYPGDEAKLRKMAEDGDVAAVWLLKKLETSGIARAINKLCEADDEVITDIATILLDIEKQKIDTDDKEESKTKLREAMHSKIKVLSENISKIRQL